MNNKYVPPFIWLLLCLVVVLIGWDCGPNQMDKANPNYLLKAHPTYQNTGWPLIAYDGIRHVYKDDLEKIIFPTHNRKLTYYCSVHFEWEDITARWGPDKLSEPGNYVFGLAKPGNYRWNYHVSTNKKSWK